MEPGIGAVRRIVVLVVVAVVLAAGCSSDDDGGGEAGADSAAAADATTSTATTTSPSTAEEEGVDPLPPLDDAVALPIVFVHGFAGSAQQYESAAMRFVANGYPAERIVAYDHDGAGFDIEGYARGVVEVVDAALAEHGAEQVYLVGHSRGTGVSSAYLSDPANAAKVAKYVAIDGAPCPDAVPCLELTQDDFPGQAHVEVATSAESFAAQYEFLVGEPPAVVDIVPQASPVVLEGRAVNFPANTGRAGATLEVWAIDADTGMRTEDEPHARFELGDDGAFGPVEVTSGARYEFVLTSPSSAVQHHLYLPPYVRSSHLVRLLSSPPDGPTRVNTNAGDGHTSLIAIRMREWYAADDADLPGDQRDVLEVGVRGGELVDVLAPFVGNGGIGVHVHDDAATPGATTLEPLPYFSEQPFQSGVDVFLPAADPPDATVTVVNHPRGDRSATQSFNIPNWPSSGHAVSLMFADH